MRYKQLKLEMQKKCRKAFNGYISDIIHESYESGKKKNFLITRIKSLHTADYCGVDTLQKDSILYSDNLEKATFGI